MDVVDLVKRISRMNRQMDELMEKIKAAEQAQADYEYLKQAVVELEAELEKVPQASDVSYAWRMIKERGGILRSAENPDYTLPYTLVARDDGLYLGEPDRLAGGCFPIPQDRDSYSGYAYFEAGGFYTHEQAFLILNDACEYLVAQAALAKEAALQSKKKGKK